MSRGDKISMCYTEDLILIEFTRNTAMENFAVLRLSIYCERNSNARNFVVYFFISLML